MKHSPSEITLFQIALILGMLLIGIILSPLLIRSRHLAQQPKWRNRHAHTFHNGRKWTAFSIYAGTALMVGLIGHCIKFYLPTDPYSWLVIFQSDLKKKFHITLNLYFVVSVVHLLRIY